MPTYAVNDTVQAGNVTARVTSYDRSDRKPYELTKGGARPASVRDERGD